MKFFFVLKNECLAFWNSSYLITQTAIITSHWMCRYIEYLNHPIQPLNEIETNVNVNETNDNRLSSWKIFLFQQNGYAFKMNASSVRIAACRCWIVTATIFSVSSALWSALLLVTRENTSGCQYACTESLLFSERGLIHGLGVSSHFGEALHTLRWNQHSETCDQCPPPPDMSAVVQ